jgi:hypothetical protein
MTLAIRRACCGREKHLAGFTLRTGEGGIHFVSRKREKHCSAGSLVRATALRQSLLCLRFDRNA